MFLGKKMTAEDVLKLFEKLSDDEKEKVISGLNKPETEDEHQIEEAEEHIEERGEENGTPDQTAKDVEDKSVGEQEHEEGDEDSQTAKDRIDESEGAEEADEEKAVTEDVPTEEDDEVRKALMSRLEALEAKISELESALAEKVEKDNDQDFGSTPSLPSNTNKDEERMSEVMRGYAGDAARRYY